MSSVSQRFNKFLSNIQLTENQIKDAIIKHRGVRKTLHEAFYPSTSASKSYSAQEETRKKQELINALETSQVLHSFNNSEVTTKSYASYSTSLLVGSYGKSTAIAPPSDIDILFKMPSAKFADYDQKSYNGQSRLLQDVRNVLKAAYPKTNIRADGQVVMVPFVTFNVEVLPVFETKTTGLYLYPDTNQGGSWRLTNPEAEMKYISEANSRAKGNVIRLIKMIKAWKQHCNVNIKSMVIELHAVYFLNNWKYYDKPSVYYDLMVRDFFADLLKYVNGTCGVPGLAEKISYGNAWEAKARKALEYATQACVYEKDESGYLLATSQWKNIFGDRFYYL